MPEPGRIIALGGVAIFPWLAKAFDQSLAIFFPPLGDNAAAWRFMGVLLIVSAALLSIFLRPMRIRLRWKIALLIAAMCLSLGYIALHEIYVVPITFPDGQKQYIVRGSERTAEAKKDPYASMTEVELIENAGLNNEGLEHAYTAKSLLLNRLKLFMSYVLALMCLEFLVGQIGDSEPSQETATSTPNSTTE